MRKQIRQIVVQAIAGTTDLTEAIDELCDLHNVMPQLLCVCNDMKFDSLTKGKKYKLVYETKGLYYFIDNKGVLNWKKKEWFKIVKAQ